MLLCFFFSSTKQVCKIVQVMRFDPKTNRYPYPLETDHHYLKVKKNDGTVFDRNYPYVDKSKGFFAQQRWLDVLLYCIVYPLTYIRLGLKIKNKKKLKEYKEIIKDGVISVANHVHMWDYLAIKTAIAPIHPRILVWGPNVSGENGKMIRSVGGIPIPEGDVRATKAYLDQVKEYLNEGGWLHIYPEGSMWEYYAPVRPFKRGPAYLAIAANKPILPMGFSYRKPGWFRRVFMKQLGCFTLTIGDPIYPDPNLSGKEQEIDLTKRVHEAVCKLNGFEEGENPYEPLFNDSKRIDYYTDSYGHGYKGSW